MKNCRPKPGIKANLSRQDKNLYSQINHKLQWHREVTTDKYNIRHYDKQITNTYTYNIYITMEELTRDYNTLYTDGFHSTGVLSNWTGQNMEQQDKT